MLGKASPPQPLPCARSRVQRHTAAFHASGIRGSSIYGVHLAGTHRGKRVPDRVQTAENEV
jgi:hypothetical protein